MAFRITYAPLHPPQRHASLIHRLVRASMIKVIIEETFKRRRRAKRAWGGMNRIPIATLALRMPASKVTITVGIQMVSPVLGATQPTPERGGNSAIFLGAGVQTVLRRPLLYRRSRLLLLLQRRLSPRLHHQLQIPPIAPVLTIRVIIVAVSTTETGKTCMRWDEQDPHSHTRTPSNYPGFGLEDNNFCRNPDGEPRAWCYTTDPGHRWEFCNVPRCATCNNSLRSLRG